MHFRAGIGGDTKISETAGQIISELDDLASSVRNKISSLEASLTQIEQYQRLQQQLRQKIMHEEQQLRLALAPTYLPHDRERALNEQQVGLVCFIAARQQTCVLFCVCVLCIEWNKFVLQTKNYPLLILIYCCIVMLMLLFDSK